MATARIYQRPKNAMQSGRARTDALGARFRARRGQAPRSADWLGRLRRHREQVRLGFPTQEAAIAYAEREGLAFTVIAAPERKLKLQAYADNFR